MHEYPLLFLIWLLPLVGAVFLFAFGPQVRTWGGPIGAAAIGAAFAAALTEWNDATTGAGAHQIFLTWLPGFAFGLQWDRLSLVWTMIITGVGFLIHVYSIGYLAGDRAFPRFFAYMNFFVFAMLTLVLSDNFVGLLIGWGLVGLASYFLIGWYFERPIAVAAARKAFVINVVGDIGILYAIFVIVTHLGSIGYGDVFANAGKLSQGDLFTICLGLFIGCAAKSAQVPLHTWLPDAMEGPTPVSALIHAATMVTAGVYLIARCAPLWVASDDARVLVGAIGAITALTGAILGTAQWDIKRILAYSTMSQIGYMIMGVGVGAFDAGVLHFLTHAFFKAQLFLGAGIVIHHLANEQDVRRMGGLHKVQPFAFWAMLLGVLSICGVPGFSGFFSKDAVLTETLARGHVELWAIGVLTAGITAYYMFRMLFVAFFGAYRGNVDPSDLGLRHPELAGTAAPHAQHDTHAHAPAWLMSAPVAILMVPTVLIGWLDAGGEQSPWGRFFAPFFPHMETVGTPPPELATSALVLLVVIIGFGIAYWRYGTAAALSGAVERLRQESVHQPAPLVHAFYFDAAIDALFVRPSIVIGRWFGTFVEAHVIDAGVREASISANWLGHLARSFQTGLVRAYALTLVFGAACFVVYYALAGGWAVIVAALVLGPILIGLFLYLLPKDAQNAARIIGIAVAVAVFALAAYAGVTPVPDASHTWLARPFGAAFHLGFGPLSYWIVLLLALATFGALLALHEHAPRGMTAQLLILQGAMNGVFLAKDLLLFALFWDLMLIPVFLIMIGFGEPVRGTRARGTAAWRYLIYNMVGGLALLLATAAFGVVHGSTDVLGDPHAGVAIGSVWGPWIFAGFTLAFLIKTPVWPLHTWMPDTYAELPPPAVAIVSAVQSKAGLYGFIAIGLPFLGDEMHVAAPLMFGLGLVALFYGALIALTQNDAKRIVAYSSLSHLGLILIAIFTFQPLALAGAAVYIIGHGLFSAALFLVLGFLEQREETRLLPRLGGLAWNNPRLAGAFMLAALAALGLPGLAGFAGELLILTGIYAAGFWWVALIALIPIVLAAGYMLRAFQTIMNGPMAADLPERRDLTWIEGLALAPLVIAFVLLGVNPGPVAAFAVQSSPVSLNGANVGAR